ncbi:DeoR/GlpR family DNA-binding transcription regulator [Pararhizobium mangrovi]|uniref:DeoR/GlpR transcriptional regulator n=1 Tax=Pararhizobium mangrovi TaxID=2590452 RepID=A0A506U7C1_9HYPH|nr:DeoR/GlpR family DNA-binding transcription regulator [Pararhizobium mangrovi]TPW30312.1 DeoR/GlpR transcriptional regulator [Pararhizobium mangrovi]
MSMSGRQEKILRSAKQVGRVEVEDLVEQYRVSAQTIRKDLNVLTERGLLSRTHGGAEVSSGVENLEYEARKLIAASEKAAIGRATADLIPAQSSLFINIGTTTEAVAHWLGEKAGLMAITNNINVATLLRPYGDIEVVIAGGVVRPSDGGIVGEAAVDFIGQFRVDYAIIGASAIDADGTLLDFDYREVRVTQAIIRNARQVVLVSDSSKFTRSAPVRIGHLSQINTFVTDRAPDAIVGVCREHDVALIQTGDDPVEDERILASSL